MNQTVVITGGSAGIGRAVAAEYARRGARLGLIARGAAGLAGAKAQCESLGAQAVATNACDIADASALTRATETLRQQTGEPDVWINNAMVSVFAPAWQITPQEYERVTAVNYLGTVYGTLAALETMRARRRGTIVQVGSALAYRGIPLQAAYCASKHAVQGFVESLRAELLHEYPGITVGMVQLPAVNTPQFSWVRTRLPRHPRPMGKVFTPQAMAKAIVWAADHGVRELTVGGPTGMTRIADALAPDWLDHKLANIGYEGQQTESPVDLATWKDNVDSPLDDSRDYGIEGAFSDEASEDLIVRVPNHGSLIVAAAAATGLAGLASCKALLRMLDRHR
jgi:short-subunit dehydrogenase